MKSVFGPVPSRRLGRSLGIDPIPMKTCNWNCVYCQLGRSVPLCGQRREYIPTKTILQEVENAIQLIPPDRIDWITFVGSGEPTLHINLGELIRAVQWLTDFPVAILTNGALLYRSEIRRDLLAADAVLPTLDAGDRTLYRKINRPWPELTFERHIDGLRTFRQEYPGKLWIEVMLVAGLNDGEAELQAIKTTLDSIEPDEIHINIPTRPPAEPWVRIPQPEKLQHARQLFGEIAKVVGEPLGNIEIFSDADFSESILEIISRHPLDERTLVQMLAGWSTETVLEMLRALQEQGVAQRVQRYGRSYWCSAQSIYP